MTHHMTAEDTDADIRTLKNLRNFVGMFAVFSLLLALGVTIFAP